MLYFYYSTVYMILSLLAVVDVVCKCFVGLTSGVDSVQASIVDTSNDSHLMCYKCPHQSTWHTVTLC